MGSGRLLGGAILLVVAIFFVLVPAIPQDPAYHDFVDKRAIFGIENFWNVASNLPFLLAGIYGLLKLPLVDSTLRPIARIYSIGLVLICFGSGYYHLAPSNDTLLWDRAAMTVSFMAFFAFIIARVTTAELGNKWLWPLVLVGLLSVFYWYRTESMGDGDLRAYAVVQFLPSLIIPILVLCYSRCFPGKTSQFIWLGLIAYVAAKLSEWQDMGLYELTSLISGHSIKHVLAAISSYFFLRAILELRTPDKINGDRIF